MPRFSIGSFEFATKKAATEKVQSILNTEGLDTGNNRAIIAELVLMHPSYETDIDGYVSLGIRASPENPKQHQFCYAFADGRTDCFSYKNCLNGKYNRRQRLIQQFRASIHEQIAEFRNSHFERGSQCPLCGSVMNSCDIDHIVKFRDILAQFLTSKNTSIDAIDFDVHTLDFSIGPQGKDEIVNEWQEFHRRNAQLRVICSACNRRLA
jgi:hypothetical protein